MATNGSRFYDLSQGYVDKLFHKSRKQFEAQKVKAMRTQKEADDDTIYDAIQGPIIIILQIVNLDDTSMTTSNS